MSDYVESSVDSIQIGPDDSQASVRVKVWAHLERHGIALDPKPEKWTIPNFQGSKEAGAKMSELQVFKDATVVRTDFDDSLQEIRFRTLQAGKTLLVPTPNRRDQAVYRSFLKSDSPPEHIWPLKKVKVPESQLRYHVVCKSFPPKDSPPEQLRTYATRQGIELHSKVIDIKDELSVDVFVVGSIAVSPKGHRIGRGGLSSGWEYSIMFNLGAVKDHVPVITVVHDHQVMDLPSSLFGINDLPVDVIVTPTRIIHCTEKVQKFVPVFGRSLSGVCPVGDEDLFIQLLTSEESFHAFTVLTALDNHKVYVSSKAEREKCKDKQAGQSAMACNHIKAQGVDKEHFIKCATCGLMPLLNPHQAHILCRAKWCCRWCPNVNFQHALELGLHGDMDHLCNACKLYYAKTG